MTTHLWVGLSFWNYPQVVSWYVTYVMVDVDLCVDSVWVCCTLHTGWESVKSATVSRQAFASPIVISKKPKGQSVQKAGCCLSKPLPWLQFLHINSFQLLSSDWVRHSDSSLGNWMADYIKKKIEQAYINIIGLSF